MEKLNYQVAYQCYLKKQKKIKMKSKTCLWSGICPCWLLISFSKWMILISLFCLLRKEVRSNGRIWPNLRTSSVSTWQEPSSDWSKVDNLRFLDQSIASPHNPSLDFDFKITAAPRICCKTCWKKLPICSKIRRLVEKLPHLQICSIFLLQ